MNKAKAPRPRGRVIAAALVAPLAIPAVVAFLASAVVMNGSSLDESTPIEYVATMATISLMFTYPVSLLVGLPVLLTLNVLGRLTSMHSLIVAVALGVSIPLAIMVFLRFAAPNPQFSVDDGRIFLFVGAPASLIVSGVFCLLAGLPWRTPEPAPPEPEPKANPLMFVE